MDYEAIQILLVQKGASKTSKTGEAVNLMFFYSRKVIFGSVMYFCIINCLTLTEIPNSESHISNLIGIKTA